MKDEKRKKRIRNFYVQWMLCHLFLVMRVKEFHPLFWKNRSFSKRVLLFGKKKQRVVAIFDNLERKRMLRHYATCNFLREMRSYQKGHNGSKFQCPTVWFWYQMRKLYRLLPKCKSLFLVFLFCIYVEIWHEKKKCLA